MPKKLLTDLLNEMKSQCINDTFEIDGHSYKMMLLNGEEADWRNKYVVLNGLSPDKPSLNMGILNSVKKPTLAVGIREIDGHSIESQFEEDWDNLNSNYKLELMSEFPDNAKKWFVAERFLDYIKQWPDSVIEEIWKSWVKLTERRDAAKEELKKSLGESETNPNSAQLSPSGDR